MAGGRKNPEVNSGFFLPPAVVACYKKPIAD